MPAELPTAADLAALKTDVLGAVGGVRDSLARYGEQLDRIEGLLSPTPDPQPTPVPQPQPAPVPPAGFWPSGGNPNNNTQAGAEAFGNWRRRKCTVALHYPTRTAGWGPLVSAPTYWADKTVRLMVQMPFSPQGGEGYATMLTSQSVYDNWRRLGANWKARKNAGYVDCVFSPGWEHNHSGLHYWGGPGSGQKFADYAQFVGVYRRFVTAVRETYPEAEFAWTLNGHDCPGYPAGAFPANDPRNTYPGDAYVDYVGLDYYDHFPPSFGGTSTSSRRRDFDVEAGEVNGIRWYIDYAHSRGKRFLCLEWACNSGNVAGGDHGGDNPVFVANMFGEFTYANGLTVVVGGVTVPVMAGEIYYEDTAQKMGIYNGQNPRAAAEYLRLWRPAA